MSSYHPHETFLYLPLLPDFHDCFKDATGSEEQIVCKHQPWPDASEQRRFKTVILQEKASERTVSVHHTSDLIYQSSLNFKQGFRLEVYISANETESVKTFEIYFHL